MKSKYLFLPLLVLLTSLNLGIVLSVTKIKEFSDITITTGESLLIDLNEYFVGNNTKFTVQAPLSIEQKYQLMSSQPQFFNGDNNIISVDIPRDVFANWAPTEPYIFLDSSKTLHFFKQTGAADAPTLTFDKNVTFDDDPRVSCNSILRMNTTLLIISCTLGTALQPYQIFFNLTTSKPYPGKIETTTPGARQVAKFPNNPNYLITYPPADPTCQNSAVIIVYNVTNLTNIVSYRTITRANFNTTNACLMKLAIADETLLFIDYKGFVYRADNVVSDLPMTTRGFQIKDNLLGMTAVFETYHGQPVITLAVESTTYIYHCDWTDPENPISINKYPLSPIGQPQDIVKIRHLEISQDFISTVATTKSGDCRILIYYKGQSLADEYYHMEKCAIDTNLMHTSRSTNSIFFLTNNSPTLDVSIYEIFRSILNITIPNPGSATPKISADDQVIQELNIRIIDTQDYNVTTTDALDNMYFGLTVPGQATFDITGLFNGPFLNYTSSDENYQVIPYYQDITFNPSGSPVDGTVFTVYSPPESKIIYWLYAANDALILQTCTETSIQSYQCASQSANISGTVLDITASDSYLYVLLNASSAENGSLTIQIYDYALNTNDTLTLPDSEPSCDLKASQSSKSPFLYCLGTKSVYVYRVDNLTIAQTTLTKLDIDDLGIKMANATIELNHNFLSILFFQTNGVIYLIDTFALMLKAAPILSSINIDGNLDLNYSFAVGGQSIVIYVVYELTLTEYDISHPESPVLIKSYPSPSQECTLVQMLSDSQNADNIYIYGRTTSTSDLVALVYQPQTTGNSNYLTLIPLPTSIFPPFDPNFLPPRYPLISTSGQGEIFVVPNADQLGWAINTDIQVNYAATVSDDSNAVDFQETVQILFTATAGSHNYSSAVGGVSVNIILTDEKVNAIETFYYPPGFSQIAKRNVLSVDPRNFFNGSISNYSIAAENSSETAQIELTQQVTPGTSNSLGQFDVYGLNFVNEAFIIQAKDSVLILNNGNITTVIISKQSTAYDIRCDNYVYNPYQEYVFSACLEATRNRYFFSLINLKDATPIQELLIDSADTGKIVSSISRVVFANSWIFILENNPTYGSFIHVFSFQAPKSISYVTSVTSADLDLNTLNIADFTINSLYDAEEYRLYLIDPDQGLITLNISATTTISFSNPQIYPLKGPPNANWNGIVISREQRDPDSPVELMITSPTYKNYFIQCDKAGVRILMTFVSIPNSNVIRPCYSDGHNFVMSVVSQGKNYALLYSTSSLSSKTNAQNFPLLSVEYDSNKQGACSYTFDSTSGPSFFIYQHWNISNYTINSNITLAWDTELGSKYIKVQGNGINNNDTLQLYLIPQPTNGPDVFSLILIIGGIALLILVALLCYCNVRYRKNKRNSDSYYERMGVDDADA